MELYELVLELKLLERRLTLYEEKYGVFFYRALIAGELAHYDEYDECREDFRRWNRLYQTWLRCKNACDDRVREQTIVKALRFQPAY